MPDPTPDAIREAFERYMRDETGRERDLTKDRDGDYLYMNVEDEWRAFQAGAAWAAAHKEQGDDGK